VQKMLTIDLVGSAPHLCEIYSYQRRLPSFFILPETYSPNVNSHLDHNVSIDADFLKEVPFGSVEVMKENFMVIFAPKIEKFLYCSKSMKLLHNF
jgi:hypothetical protein